MVGRFVWLPKDTTTVAPSGAKPQTMACFGEAARMEFDPDATANRKFCNSSNALVGPSAAQGL